MNDTTALKYIQLQSFSKRPNKTSENTPIFFLCMHLSLENYAKGMVLGEKKKEKIRKYGEEEKKRCERSTPRRHNTLFIHILELLNSCSKEIPDKVKKNLVYCEDSG